MVTTQEVIQREAPDIEARRLGLLDTAKYLADQPLTLPQQQAAALEPEAAQARLLATSGIGSYQPFISSALQSQAAGLGTLGQAAQQFSSPTQQDVSQFMNPYQQAIRDEINRAYNIAQQGQAAQAVRSGAFGGGREGIAQAELERNRASALAQAQAQAFLNAQQRQLAGAQGLAAIAPQYGSFAGQQAQLGLTGQQAGLQDIQSLLGIGGLFQEQAQREADIDRANQMAQIYEPYQRVGFLSDIYAGAPTSTQTISTSTAPSISTSSPLRQVAGYGIAGLSALGGLKSLSGGGLF